MNLHSKLPARAAAAFSASRSRFALALFSAVFLSGCAAVPGGIHGYDAFMRQTPALRLAGARPAGPAARCFQERATFLPLSEFVDERDSQGFIYRLRVAGLWFEQVRITEQDGGSRAEVWIAPNLQARWTDQFNRDRGAALAACLAP